MAIRPPFDLLIADQLRDKALLALEDAVVECRYRTPRRSFAIRFALAYLWVYGGRRDREPYNRLWRSLGSEKSPWSYSVANGDLGWIYRALGIERPDEIGSMLWREWTMREGNGGGQ